MRIADDAIVGRGEPKTLTPRHHVDRTPLHCTLGDFMAFLLKASRPKSWRTCNRAPPEKGESVLLCGFRQVLGDTRHSRPEAENIIQPFETALRTAPAFSLHADTNRLGVTPGEGSFSGEGARMSTSNE